MKKTILLFIAMLLTVLLCSCGADTASGAESDPIDATEMGLSPDNDGITNSKALQAAIDKAAESGKCVYIPEGEYEFAENGTQTIGSHCIKMRSGVSVKGAGDGTVLKPVGNSRYGMDMFYFNEYLDTGAPIYLENCNFESFVIDASGTSCDVYTSAGKGFMFNLFKNCTFKGITVKYTDATGFGVDCPINCSIIDCIAIGCGKAAPLEGGGASGFGIGFGYSEGENILIEDCTSRDNRKFGFFLEHQGRFNSEKYKAAETGSFTVKGCFAEGNLYGFGGICAFGTNYEDCTSQGSLRYGFYFEDSHSSEVRSSVSSSEREGCFAVCWSSDDADLHDKSPIRFIDCEGKESPIGTLAYKAPLPETVDCVFYDIEKECVIKED